MKTVTPMSCAPNETRCRDYGTNTNSDPCELLSCGILGTSKELPGIPTPCGNNDAAYAGQKDKKRKKKTNDSATYVAQKEMDKWVRPSAKIGAEFSVSGQSLSTPTATTEKERRLEEPRLEISVPPSVSELRSAASTGLTM